jgi:hypothetical protein
MPGTLLGTDCSSLRLDAPRAPPGQDHSALEGLEQGDFLQDAEICASMASHSPAAKNVTG